MSNETYSQRLKTTKRNDPCPCGSGRKYKKCHLEADEAALHAATKKAQEAAAQEAAAKAADEADDDADTGSANKKDTSAGAERPSVRQNKPGRGAGQNPRPKNLPRRKAV